MRFGEDEDWFHRAREHALIVRRLDQIGLIVRRHDTNMTRGKTMIKLYGLKIVKKALDRARDQRGGTVGPAIDPRP